MWCWSTPAPARRRSAPPRLSPSWSSSSSSTTLEPFVSALHSRGERARRRRHPRPLQALLVGLNSRLFVAGHDLLWCIRGPPGSHRRRRPEYEQHRLERPGSDPGGPGGHFTRPPRSRRGPGLLRAVAVLLRIGTGPGAGHRPRPDASTSTTDDTPNGSPSTDGCSPGYRFPWSSAWRDRGTAWMKRMSAPASCSKVAAA